MIHWNEFKNTKVSKAFWLSTTMVTAVISFSFLSARSWRDCSIGFAAFHLRYISTENVLLRDETVLRLDALKRIDIDWFTQQYRCEPLKATSIAANVSVGLSVRPSIMKCDTSLIDKSDLSGVSQWNICPCCDKTKENDFVSIINPFSHRRQRDLF